MMFAHGGLAMKRLVLAVVLGYGMFASAVVAQAPQTAPVTSPPAVAPAAKLAEIKIPTTMPDGIRYLNDPSPLVFCTKQVVQFNDRNADMIFIGDSITQNWLGPGKAVWEANFVPRNALDFGISSDRTQHVLWRLENYPLGHLHPKVGVVLIGTNNKGDTPEEIAAGVKAVLAKTQSLFPGIKIILVSIMPNWRANEKMMAANEILKTFADQKKVYYLDMVALMTPVGDSWKGLGPDRLHPDAAGYQLWTDAMLPLVDKLLGKSR
jgi:lysophospholipase L1-like esterase